jgi:hypothetical protein
VNVTARAGMTALMDGTESDESIMAASRTDPERFGAIFEGRLRFVAQGGRARPWLFGIATNLVRHRRSARAGSGRA